jgi:hypothetical protein
MILIRTDYHCLGVGCHTILQRKSTRVEPHYLNVWLLAHDDDDATPEKLVSNNIKCYISILTQYFAGMIYRRVEENPWAYARGPTVSALQR